MPESGRTALSLELETRVIVAHDIVPLVFTSCKQARRTGQQPLLFNIVVVSSLLLVLDWIVGATQRGLHPRCGAHCVQRSPIAARRQRAPTATALRMMLGGCT